MPSRSSLRHGLLALTATLLSTVVAAPAQAATPTRWLLTFSHYVPRYAGEVNIDRVTYERFDGDRPSINRQLAVKVLRDGAVISGSSHNSYWGGDLVLPELRAGDVATLSDSATGAVVASGTFDGRPVIDAQTCVGRDTFSGLRTGATAVDDVATYRWFHAKRPDGTYESPASGWRRRGYSTGDVTTLTGDTFGGRFDAPLRKGAIVLASGHRDVSPTLIISSSVERVVGACPAASVGPGAPSGVLSPLRDGVAPKAALTAAPKASKLRKISMKKLRSSGLAFSITSDEAATISATLQLSTSKKKPAKVVGKTTAPAAAGAATAITLKLAKASRSKLKGLRSSARLVVVIKVTDAAGNVTALPEIRFKVPKA